MNKKNYQRSPSRFEGYDQLTDNTGKIVKFIDLDTGEVLDAVRVIMPEGSVIITPREQRRQREYFSKRGLQGGYYSI